MLVSGRDICLLDRKKPSPTDLKREPTKTTTFQAINGEDCIIESYASRPKLNFWGRFFHELYYIGWWFQKDCYFSPRSLEKLIFGGKIASFGEGTHNLAGGFKRWFVIFTQICGVSWSHLPTMYIFFEKWVGWKQQLEWIIEQSATRCAISDGRSRTLCSSDGVAQLGTNPSVMSQ